MADAPTCSDEYHLFLGGYRAFRGLAWPGNIQQCYGFAYGFFLGQLAKPFFLLAGQPAICRFTAERVGGFAGLTRDHALILL